MTNPTRPVFAALLIIAAALLINSTSACSSGPPPIGGVADVHPGPKLTLGPMVRSVVVPHSPVSGLPADHGFGHAIYFPVPGEHYSAVVTAFSTDGHADLLYFRRNLVTDAVETGTAVNVQHFRAPFLPLAFPGAGPTNGFALLDAPPSAWRIGNALTGAPPGFVRLSIRDDADPLHNLDVDLQNPESEVHAHPELYFPFWLLSTTWGIPDDLAVAVEPAVAPIPADAGTD